MQKQELPAVQAARPPVAANLARESGAFLSFDDVIADRAGGVSAPDRLMLMRLFRALGGAVAIFSERKVAVLDRALGLPDLPLIGSGGSEVRLGRDTPLLAGQGAEAMMTTPPFAGRPLIVFGLNGTGAELMTVAGRRGAICLAAEAARETLAAWLERLAPVPFDRRSAA